MQWYFLIFSEWKINSIHQGKTWHVHQKNHKKISNHKTKKTKGFHHTANYEILTSRGQETSFYFHSLAYLLGENSKHSPPHKYTSSSTCFKNNVCPSDHEKYMTNIHEEDANKQTILRNEKNQSLKKKENMNGWCIESCEELLFSRRHWMMERSLDYPLLWKISNVKKKHKKKRETKIVA